MTHVMTVFSALIINFQHHLSFLSFLPRAAGPRAMSGSRVPAWTPGGRPRARAPGAAASAQCNADMHTVPLVWVAVAVLQRPEHKGSV